MLPTVSLKLEGEFNKKQMESLKHLSFTYYLFYNHAETFSMDTSTIELKK